MIALFLMLVSPAHACCTFGYTDVEWSFAAPSELPGMVTVSFEEAADHTLEVELVGGRTRTAFKVGPQSSAHAEVESWRSACTKGRCPDVTLPLDGGRTWSLSADAKPSETGHTYKTKVSGH